MKKLIVFVILFFISLNVYAVDVPACTDSEMTRLKEIANNVSFKKSYQIDDEEDDSVSFFYNVDIINFDSDLKISYLDSLSDEDERINLNSGQEIPTVFYEGSSVKFSIYAYTNNLCTGKLLKTVTLEFPVYNDYYYFNKEKCQNNMNFKYCKEYLDVSEIEFSKIDKLFDEYLQKNEVQSPNKKKINWYILGGGLGILMVVIVGLIVFLNKKLKKDRW